MILQRLSKAVREQNWFAVVLEFFIVIAGVVIAFQITAWAERRASLQRSHAILERLHTDIENVSRERWDWAAVRAGNRQLLLSASQKLFGEEDGDLTLAECNAITQSHVFNSPSLALPILTELESTGELDLIRSAAVRRAVTQHFLANTWSREIDTAINHEIFNLSARHPQLMRFVLGEDLENWDPIFDNSARCDSDGMRADPAFLNELADNISKSNYFLQAVLEGPNSSFDALHAAVDAELGINHSEIAP